MTTTRTFRWEWTHRALRLVAGVQALLVLTQAALAGQFLTGNSAARSVHRELGAEVITWLGLVALLLAGLAWRQGRHRVWPIVATSLGLVAVILQLGYGFEGRLDIHVPLGVTIFALYLTVLVAPRLAGPANSERQ